MAIKDVFDSSDPEALQLVEALGISDPQTVKRVIFDLEAGNVAKVYVERYGSKAAVETLLTILRSRRVEIVEGDNPEPPRPDKPIQLDVITRGV